MKITVNLDNEDVVNLIIKNYTEEVLATTLREKQLYLVRNGLASVANPPTGNDTRE